MLNYEDCLALSELEEDEIDAIAEHENLPEMAALELGSYLVHSPEGVPMIKKMIVDDIENARARGNLKHAAKLRLVLKHFVEMHPKHRTTG